jgi:hypothetical protein
MLGFIGAIAFINTQTKCDRHYKPDIPQVAATYRVINLNYSIHSALEQINAIQKEHLFVFMRYL